MTFEELLEINERYLDKFCEAVQKIEQLERKLDIAVKALESIKHTIDDFEDDPMNKIDFMAYGNLWSVRDVSKKALKQIEDLSK